MIMHSGYIKEHGGIVQNPIGPWWSGLRSQSGCGESVGHLKSSSIEHPCSGDQLTGTNQADRGTEQGLEKGNTTQFTIFPGDCKISANGQKAPQVQATFSIQPSLPEYQGRLELGYSQPVICAKYPYGDQCYGVVSTYGPQITGRIMLPLNLTADDGPIFVNAKQYHGIIRRRQSRAKAELDNKVQRNRKPYLHLSRHLHAMRRPRGCGGRFLNTKKMDNGKSGTGSKINWDGKLCQPTESQNSEVLQSDSSNLNSPRETTGGMSNLSGPEVTSMYSRGDLNFFPFNSLRPSDLSLTTRMNTGHGVVMPSKWVTTADSCCNLKD